MALEGRAFDQPSDARKAAEDRFLELLREIETAIRGIGHELNQELQRLYPRSRRAQTTRAAPFNNEHHGDSAGPNVVWSH